MKRKKPSISNIVILVLLVLMIIPQTRTPIQVAINRIFAKFSPSVNAIDDRANIANYDWMLYDAEDQLINFTDNQGKVVLVNFWATWCPPCIAEMPELQQLYDDYGEQVTFLFVASDDKEAVATFLSERDYTIPVYYQGSQAPKEIATQSLPTTYLIDRSGNIVIDKKGAANWNSDKVRKTIDELLLPGI